MLFVFVCWLRYGAFVALLKDLFSKAVRRLVLLHCQQHVVYYFSLAFPNAQSLPQGPLPEENVQGPLPRGDSPGENVRSAMKLAVGYARYVSLPSLAFSLRLLAFSWRLLAFSLGLLAFRLRLLAFSLRLLAFSLRLLAFCFRLLAF